MDRNGHRPPEGDDQGRVISLDVDRARKRVERREKRLAGLEARRAELDEQIAGLPDFNRELRIASLNLAFMRIEEAWQDPDLNPLGMRNLAIAHGILIDKRRLEEGEASSITAHVSPADDARAVEIRDRARAEAKRLLGEGWTGSLADSQDPE